MNTNFISFSQRTHFPHSYVITSDKEKPDESALVPSPLSIQLQRARLATQDATLPYFNGKRALIGQTESHLKNEKVVSQSKMINAALILMSKKAIQVAFKKFLYQLEQDRFYEYLKECRKKLKDNFQQLYLKVQQEKESLKKFQFKR